jgi:hypothetical protein
VLQGFEQGYFGWIGLDGPDEFGYIAFEGEWYFA